MTVERAADILLIERKLRRTRRRYILTRLVSGSAVVAFWVVGLASASFAADYMFGLPPLGRLFLLVISAVLVAVAAARWVALPLVRVPDDDRLALMVEAEHPGLASSLISTVQLSRQPARRRRGVSAALIRALQAATVERVRSMNFPAVVPVRQALRLAALVMVLSATAWVVASRHEAVFSVWLDRFSHPLTSTAEYPARTQIEVLTGDTIVPRGEDVEIAALASGEVPRRGTLHLRPRGGAWQKLDLVPAEPGSARFTAKLSRLLETTEYYVELGDSRSEVHTLDVVARPRVTELAARYQLPAYAGGGTRESPTGDVDVLVGTWVDLIVTTNKPVVKAALELGRITLPMRSDEQGRLRARFQVREDGTYTVQLRDSLGLANRDPIVHLVRALEDRSPRVTVRKPGRNIDTTPVASLPIEFQVKDDFGVSAVELRYAIQKPVPTGMTLGGEEGVSASESATEPAQGAAVVPEFTYATLPLAGPFRGKLVRGQHILEFEQLGVAEGDTVVYSIWAADNRDLDTSADDRNWGGSREYEVHIVSPQTKREEIRRRLEEAVREIQLIIDRQKGTRDAVGGLIELKSQ